MLQHVLHDVYKKFSLKANYLFFIFLVLVFISFYSQKNLFYVPDSDFFAFPVEGKMLLTNPFAKVMSAPLYSIVTYLFELLLPIQYPALTGGIVFNILCLILTIYIIFKNSNKLMTFIYIVPIFLIVANPLTLIVNVQPLNIPLGVLLITAALYAYIRHPFLSYILVFFASLARPESIVVYFTLIGWNILTKQKIPRIKSFCMLLIIATFWYLRPFLNLHALDYFSEISAKKNVIPNIQFFINSFANVPLSIQSSLSVAVIIFLWVTVGIFFLFKEKNLQPLMFYLFIVFYTGFHLFFPAAPERYSYPILPFLYLLLCWPFAIKHHLNITIRFLCIIISLGMFVFIFLNYSKSDYGQLNRWHKAERRLAAEWFNQTIIDKSIIYMFEPWIGNYYSTNDNVKYVYTGDVHEWSVNLCNYNEPVYIVMDTLSEQEGEYYDYVNGLGFFQEIQNSQEKLQSLLFITKLEKEGRWANIYKLDKSRGNLCV